MSPAVAGWGCRSCNNNTSKWLGLHLYLQFFPISNFSGYWYRKMTAVCSRPFDATYLFPDIIFACSSHQHLWIFTNLGLSYWWIRYVICKDLPYHFVWGSDDSWASPRWDWNSQNCTFLHNSQYFAGPIIKLWDSISGLEKMKLAT